MSELGYVTKDSGARQQFQSGMVRDTQDGKLRYDLAFDGPLFWSLWTGTKYQSLAAAAGAWYVCGGIEYAAEVVKALAAMEDGNVFTVVDRYAQLMMRGAVKYSERNWMKAEGEEELKRFQSSFCRHLKQYLNGERDEDHLAAVFFNMNGAEYVRQKLVSSGALPIVPVDASAHSA